MSDDFCPVRWQCLDSVLIINAQMNPARRFRLDGPAEVGQVLKALAARQ